ncbi:hypothetical protein PhCBS80983_g04689 [Powellomyces hirtus]|uniref:Serine/threonine-protein kinase n=1 Tax=Powellomyces hirtus TaxID=109895 RepID=A0A507DWT1_9FUNG|nr:hypothetical protein PhCBS80983_g04689 [Powellomyces hirtus]
MPPTPSRRPLAVPNSNRFDSSSRRVQSPSTGQYGSPQERGHNFTFSSPQKASKRFSNRIEDYEIGEMLGRGGFGFVHRAVSKHAGTYGQEVAIKMIDKRLMKAANMTRRVANEVEVHWQLRHPSILELYNYFEDQSYVYLVMEICQNGELYQYIHKRKCPLTEPEARGAIAQIVRGLLYLHANGIIHRDLKLSNLLLTENFDVKIADFGLAVKLNALDGEQKTMCGTPNYISPEIVSRLPYGLTSDVWSLGCMVVTVLTGTPPFESKAVKSTLDKVSRVEYTLPAHLSSDARDLVHRLLQKDPKKRLALQRVLSHPFFNPTLPVLSLRPLSAVFDSSQLNKQISRHESSQCSAESPSHYRAPPRETSSYHSSRDRADTERHSGLNRELRRAESKENIFIGKTNRETESVRNQRNYSPSPTTDRYRTLSTASGPSPHSHASSGSPPAFGSPTTQPSNHNLAQTEMSPSTSNASPSHLPPFSTVRLKPLKQKTKHGTVTILSTGSLLLDFFGEEYLMVISGDSSQIHLYDRTGDPTNPTESPIRSYQRSSLPAAFAKKFRYASRFVDLVRSKTPKIIFYSPQAKCVLMENSPLADFETMFYNSIRAHYSVSSGTIEIKIPRSDDPEKKDFEKHQIPLSSPLEGNAASDRVDIPMHLAPIVRHVQECLKQCMDVERSGKLDSGSQYPIILKSSHCRVVSAASKDAALPREKDSFHPSAMSTYTKTGSAGYGPGPSSGYPAGSSSGKEGGSRYAEADGVGSKWEGQHSSDRPERPPLSALNGDPTTRKAALASEERNGRPMSATTSNVGSSRRPTAAPIRATVSDTVATTSRKHMPSTTAGGSARGGGAVDTGPLLSSAKSAASGVGGSVGSLNFQHLPDVGWCVKTNDGKFVMLFNDGVRTVVDPRDQTMEWMPGPGEETRRFNIDRHLPDFAKAKLAFFPQFLRLAALGSGQQQQTSHSDVPPRPGTTTASVRSSSSAMRYRG